jgi:acyl-coenzyme A synthetase/AMP-(fatty) acid ligase
VLRVVNVLPQEQVTWVTAYCGWMLGFKTSVLSVLVAGSPSTPPPRVARA